MREVVLEFSIRHSRLETPFESKLTFLLFFCSHIRTDSNPCNDSGLLKNSALGLPSFFGPRDAIAKVIQDF